MDNLVFINLIKKGVAFRSVCREPKRLNYSFSRWRGGREPETFPGNFEAEMLSKNLFGIGWREDECIFGNYRGENLCEIRFLVQYYGGKNC